MIRLENGWQGPIFDIPVYFYCFIWKTKNTFQKWSFDIKLSNNFGISLNETWGSLFMAAYSIRACSSNCFAKSSPSLRDSFLIACGDVPCDFPGRWFSLKSSKGGNCIVFTLPYNSLQCWIHETLHLDWDHIWLHSVQNNSNDCTYLTVTTSNVITETLRVTKRMLQPDSCCQSCFITTDPKKIKEVRGGIAIICGGDRSSNWISFFRAKHIAHCVSPVCQLPLAFAASLGNWLENWWDSSGAWAPPFPSGANVVHLAVSFLWSHLRKQHVKLSN